MMRHRNKHYLILTIVVMLLVSLACYSRSSELTRSASNLVAYQPVNGNGKPQLEISMVDTKGNRINQVVLSGNPIYDLYDKAIGKFVLVFESPFYIEDNLFLVDWQEGSQVPLPGTLSPSDIISGNTGNWFAALWKTQGYIVNSLTGEWFDLRSILTDLGDIVYGEFSPDDKYFVIYTTSKCWVLLTSDPSLPIQRTGFSLSFSSDSKYLAYAKTTQDGMSTILLERLGSPEVDEIFKTDDRIYKVAFIPEKHVLLIVHANQLSLLNTDNQSIEKEIKLDKDLSGTIQAVVFSPNGDKVLLLTLSNSYLVDLSTKKYFHLNMSSNEVRYENETTRWVFSSRAFSSRVSSINLETGEITELFSPTGGTPTYTSFDHHMCASVSYGGRFCISYYTDSEKNLQLWLVDAQKHSVELLVEQTGPRAKIEYSLSPDGKWIVVNAYQGEPHTGDSIAPADLVLISTEDPNSRMNLGTGIHPVWINP